jgi:hypothetical protein
MTASPVVTAEVRLLDPDEARDGDLVAELVRVINEAYAVGETGLWLEGTTRTGPAEIAEAIRSYVRPLDAGTTDLHPEKDRLRSWYTRLGYRVVRSAPIEEVAAHLASRLARSCEFLIFHKPLAPA